MNNKSPQPKRVLYEALIYSLAVFPLYGFEWSTLPRYLVFALIAFPLIYGIKWGLTWLRQKLTDRKEGSK